MKELYEHDDFPYNKWFRVGLGGNGEDFSPKKRATELHPHGGNATAINQMAPSLTVAQVLSDESTLSMNGIGVPNDPLQGTQNRAQNLHEEGTLTTKLLETWESHSEKRRNVAKSTSKFSL